MRGIFKIGIILTALVLLTPFVVASELNIEASPETAIRGEQIIVTVVQVQDGTPLENVFLQFSIDEGTPIYAKTNATGQVVFKPEIAGALKIIAVEYGNTRTVTINPPSTPPPPPQNGGGSDGWITVTLGSGTFNVTTKKTEYSSGNTYSVDRRTALGALDVSGVSYTVIDKDENIDWWGTWETLYVDSIRGKEHKLLEGKGWSYWVNYPTDSFPNVGANKYPIKDGDKVYWYWSESMDTTPANSPDVPIYIKVRFPSGSGSPSDDEGGISPTPTPTPTQIVNETKPIEPIEAGENASVTFEKTDITRIIINANNTIRNAEITIRQIKKPANITNVSGIPYCYFNITTTNLTAADITNATIEFKVNKTWINESNIDETTITLNRYSDINNNWSALPTSKIKEDNASLYFESETPGFSLFAISGEEKTAPLSTETETGASEATVTPTPTTSSPSPSVTPLQKSSLMGKWGIIVIGCIITALIIVFVNIYYRKKRRKE